MNKVNRLLEKHADEVRQIWKNLYEYDTLTGKEIDDIINLKKITRPKIRELHN